MPFALPILTVQFTNDDDITRQEIAAAADTLIQSGQTQPRLRVIAAGEALSPETISTLISALRKLREIGGAIELIGESVPVRAAIVLNGLLHVFAFPLEDNPYEPKTPKHHWRRFRVATSIFIFLASLIGLGSYAQAESITTTNPATLLAQVITRNEDLSSYESRVHINIRLTGLPFFNQRLEGSTYFKHPANYEVVFDRVPSYAKGFQKLYSDVGDPAAWEQKFLITYAGEQTFEHKTDLALHLVQRVRGMIDHETVLIDPTAWTIDQIRYDYYNGGTITMTQHFSDINGYSMLSTQTADINVPYVHAIATGTYSDYRTNLALSDALFGEKK